MTKTYSIAILNKKNIWITNWHEYFNLDDIDWENVNQIAKDNGYLAYGYYYGTHSRKLTADKCRTVVKDFRNSSQSV